MKKTCITLIALCAAASAFAADTCNCEKGDLACASACTRAKLTAAKQSAQDKADALKQAAEDKKAELQANKENKTDAADEANDRRTAHFLDWFIDEQTEEEKTAAMLLEKFSLLAGDNRGLYELDAELGKR